MAILGVDIGTTSVKVLAATPQGETIATSEKEYLLYEPQPGFKEQDPTELLAAVELSIKNTVEQLPDNQHIEALAFSSAMHSVIGMDAEGSPVTNAIIWADKRSNAYAEKLRNSEVGRQIYKHTGAPIHAMLPLCKIAWLRDHMPDTFARIDKFISIKEFLFYKWFNTYVVDHSIASATGFFNTRTLHWDQQALTYAGIHADRLSSPVPTTHILKASAALAHKFGIPPETPFVIGASDGCLANLNASGLDAQAATLTLGTSGAIRITVDKFDHDPQMRVFNYILTDRYRVIGGPTNNGGNVLEWVMDKLYPDLSDYDEVLEKIKAVPAGADGLICAPYFNGERAPLWDVRVAGEFYGVQGYHSRDHFGRAAIEGVIFNLFNISQGLQAAALTEIKYIQADGGMTKSDLIVQIIADVFNLPVYLSDSSHGTDRGAVLLGAYALKLIDSLDTKASNDKTFHPDAQSYEVLQKNYQEFVRLVKEQQVNLEKNTSSYEG